MIRISKKTKLKSEEVMEKAVQCFSKELGVKMTDLTTCCAYFEGGEAT
jgi:L-ribulose-5-phosphate 3-epimerase UlaE